MKFLLAVLLLGLPIAASAYNYLDVPLSGAYQTPLFRPIKIKPVAIKQIKVEQVQVPEMKVLQARIAALSIKPQRVTNFKYSYFWQDEEVSRSASMVDGQVQVVPVYEKRLNVEFIWKGENDE